MALPKLILILIFQLYRTMVDDRVYVSKWHLIPISAFLFNKYSYRKLFSCDDSFTLGSLVCGISSFTIMMVGSITLLVQVS